ncbi:PREDICTED: uncharacterized protein LOC109479481 [Branchiostoma belcheri]|uniref:Uncharacterized protein LOC109479481 n=1 Tax=Branchiostoma belcheri TaxID=7741 RepID=A0A6P4Z6B1_BRABE|nr:PREDICTED: uncharacterized protein LOC109479481 [Branchiostoma belcheri]
MENLDLEALLECYGKLPEVNDECIKEYLEIVKKLKMFVKAAEKTATSPETVPVVKAIMVTMEGIFQEYRSQDYAATMKSTLADLKGIKDQLAQQDSQDLETVWACIEGVCEKVKSTFGLETTNIRNESNGNPMQGIECVSEKLKGMHQTFITRQINWQMGMSAFLGLSTFIECWTTFTILDKFSIENSLTTKSYRKSPKRCQRWSRGSFLLAMTSARAKP